MQTGKIKPKAYEQEELILGYVLSGESKIWNKIIKLQQFKLKTGSQIQDFFKEEDRCFNGKGTVLDEEHDQAAAELTAKGRDIRKLVQPDACVHIFRDLKLDVQNQVL